MEKDYELWQRTEYNNSIESKSYYLISQDEELEFVDMMANDYGYNCDIDYKKIADFYITDLVILKPILDKTLGVIQTNDPELYGLLKESYNKYAEDIIDG